MCPDCRSPLIVVEFEGVELDYCPDCGGTWLDSGELELITEMAGGTPGPLHAALRGAGEKRGPRRCPRCRRKLEAVSVGTAPVVVVDRCPARDGVWLDAGELGTIVREYAGSGAGPVTEFLGELFRGRPGGGAASAGPSAERP